MIRSVKTMNAAKKTAYTQTNAIVEVKGAAAGTGDNASAVRIIPLMTNGWRPISAVYHPASVATTPDGVITTSARRNQRVEWSRPCQRSHSEMTAIVNITIPSTSIVLKL